VPDDQVDRIVGRQVRKEQDGVVGLIATLAPARRERRADPTMLLQTE
jgi:hypothetical protein